MSTQTRHPWRTVARSVFQAIIAASVAAPFVYSAITEQEPATATGGAATALVVAGAVTRVMALPAVDAFLRRFVPFLASEPADQDA